MWIRMPRIYEELSNEELRKVRRAKSRTAQVRIDREVLEGLKELVLRKYGKIKGILYVEVSRAVDDYVRAHAQQAEQQQQKDFADFERKDVRDNLNLIQQALYNDASIGSRLKGYRLGGVIRSVLSKRGLKGDKRTVRGYALRLMRHKIIKFVKGSGRCLLMGGEEYELI